MKKDIELAGVLINANMISDKFGLDSDHVFDELVLFNKNFPQFRVDDTDFITSIHKLYDKINKASPDVNSIKKNLFIKVFPDADYHIYFLFNHSKLVYIGQTSSLLSRIDSHKRDKEFNEVSYIAVNPDLRMIIENNYIIKYLPIYNKGMMSKNKSFKTFLHLAFDVTPPVKPKTITPVVVDVSDPDLESCDRVLF